MSLTKGYPFRLLISRRLGPAVQQYVDAMVMLQVGSLALRMPTLRDADDLARVLELQGLGHDQALARVRDLIERSPTLEDGGFLGLTVETSGAVVGSIQARAPDNAFPPGVCELGITLLPHARGQGLGRQVVRLLTAFLLDGEWPRVQASTACDNQAMRRVLEASAYTFEGVLRDYAPSAEGARVDYAMYAATR